jgi:hypothetical protein
VPGTTNRSAVPSPREQADEAKRLADAAAAEDKRRFDLSRQDTMQADLNARNAAAMATQQAGQHAANSRQMSSPIAPPPRVPDGGYRERRTHLSG